MNDNLFEKSELVDFTIVDSNAIKKLMQEGKFNDCLILVDTNNTVTSNKLNYFPK